MRSREVGGKAKLERAILIATITNDEFAHRVFAIQEIDSAPFSNPWANRVFGWAQEFHDRYGVAIKREIQLEFDEFESRRKEEDPEVELISRFLASLSREFELVEQAEINVEALIDVAQELFERVSLERLRDELERSLASESGSVEMVRQAVDDYRRPSISKSDSWVDILDEETIPERFAFLDDYDADEQPLLSYGGALGQFFQNQLMPDTLFTFMGPAKRGKTWWLWDAAWRAAVQDRQPTVLISAGDMSTKQLDKRGGRRIAGRPFRAGVYDVPYRLDFEDDAGRKLIKPRFDSLEFQTDLDVVTMQERTRRARERSGAWESRFKTIFEPNKTFSVHTMRDRLFDLHREGFFPKVIVIDYADILSPEPHAMRAEKRIQVDETWAALRRLSQEFHCLVITATQSDAKARGQYLIDPDNFSDSRTKLDHVNGVIGLNQSGFEEDYFSYRLNWALGREVPHAHTTWVATAGSADFANPAMISAWPRYDRNDNKR